jgi:redox-sensing transcriptional repressor
MKNIPVRTIERLFHYRNILVALLASGKESIFSYELAQLSHTSPAQVRRDLMTVTPAGSPQRGYSTSSLVNEMSRILDAPDGERAILVGIGHLGRSILSYFHHRRPKLSILAAFDSDLEKTGRVQSSCHTYALAEMPRVVEEVKAAIGIITVPAAQAQQVANAMIDAGIKGILNFAPVRIKVPNSVYLENLDITLALEKTAYFVSVRRPCVTAPLPA